MVLLDSKNVADAIVCGVKSYYGICLSKTSYLIQRRHIACSLASVRVTSSMCQPCKAHSSMSLYDDTITAISARLQRTV